VVFKPNNFGTGAKKTYAAWSRSLKFGLRWHSPACNPERSPESFQ